MKKSRVLALLLAVTTGVQAQITPTSQMELLDRGLVVIPIGSTRTLSWRFLGTDDESKTTFNILRDGETIVENKYETFYKDTKAGNSYQIVTLVDGVPVDTTEAVKPWAKNYLTVKLQRPKAGSDYDYSPNDCSVGDVDGDGQYEIFVKWDPSNSKDNSQSGITGNVFIDCYKLDGTFLWRIDLGKNIRAGAHYTQFQVYDYDGDGRAEMMCKTAPGSVDGKGNYVNQAATNATIKAASNTKDWRTSDGRINGGHEYLTVFNGLTGEAVHTIAYWPNRNAKAALSEAEGTFNWDDRSGKNDKGSYGNRGERYLAATAYLDGPDGRPSGIFCRGYYTFAYIWAVDFDGTQLKHRWLHLSDTKTTYKVMDANNKTTTYKGNTCTSGLGRYTMYANGNHNMSVADVDGDGKDEIIWGSAALDDDGKMLYAVGFGHGDAIHLADIDPDRPGYELMDIHEEPYEDKDNKIGYGYDIHDARTGEVICSAKSDRDTGRGLVADWDANYRGHEFTYATQTSSYDCKGHIIYYDNPGMNFRIYWDGDAQDELLDGITITKRGNASPLGVGIVSITGQANNSTKATPCLSADIFGDWREELIVRNNNDDGLIIYSTIENTNYRVPTLMHDHVYRMGIAWQNVAYNQPPHLGYYLPDYIESFRGIEPTGILNIEADKTKTDGKFYNLMGMPVEQPAKGVYIKNGKKLIVR